MIHSDRELAYDAIAVPAWNISVLPCHHVNSHPQRGFLIHIDDTGRSDHAMRNLIHFIRLSLLRAAVLLVSACTTEGGARFGYWGEASRNGGDCDGITDPLSYASCKADKRPSYDSYARERDRLRQ